MGKVNSFGKQITNLPFGEAVRELMAEQDGQMSYRGLASSTCLSAGYLHHVVAGKRPVPSVEIVQLIADALGVASVYFVEARQRVVLAAMGEDVALTNKFFRTVTLGGAFEASHEVLFKVAK